MKHHFLLLRHCVRSKSPSVNLGHSGFSSNPADYVADPMPDWQVPEHWCTPQGLDLVEKNGAWLVDSGIVNPGSHVELITDTSLRDVESIYGLSLGMKGALGEDSYVSGLDLIRTKSFPRSYATCAYRKNDIELAVKERLETLRRPDLDFRQALDLLEQIAGTGKVGTLAERIPINVTSNDGHLTGAANLLMNFAKTLFFSKAGLKSQRFAQKATVEQVYQLLQYADWYRSIENVENSLSATAGAIWAKIIVTIMSRGGLYDSSPRSDSVTIFEGHDDDLDSLSTALGVTWDLPEYRTHPEFLPTPPGSGLHIVRDTETGEIHVSYVYPVYHKKGHTHWKTNESGTMKRVPVIWKNTHSFEERSRASVVPSFREFESHFRSTLDKYPGAMDCYYATAKKLAESSEPVERSLVGSVWFQAHRTKRMATVVEPVAIILALAVFFILRRASRSFTLKQLLRRKHDSFQYNEESSSAEKRLCEAAKLL